MSSLTAEHENRDEKWPSYSISNSTSLDDYRRNLSEFNDGTAHSTTTDLLCQLRSLANQPLDEAQKCKTFFTQNPMHVAFYQVLCEMKEKIGMFSERLTTFIIAILTF